MIAITRAEEAASTFIEMSRELGIKVIPLDLIRLIPNHKEIERLRMNLMEKRYDYIIFMSANTIEMLDDTTRNILMDRRIIAVGPKTRASLEKYNLKVDLMPSRYSSYGIIELFNSLDTKGKKVLIPRSSASDDYLSKNLRMLGLDVDEVYVYDVRYNRSKDLDKFRELLQKDMIKCIIFTSASNVDAFFTLGDFGDMLDDMYIISIGPFTANRLKSYGVDSIISDEHTLNGILEELKIISHNL